MDPRFTPEVIEAAKQSQTACGLWASVTLAQWALESGYGAHAPHFNAFGIKARPGEPSYVTMTWEIIRGRHVNMPQRFRAFGSLAEAFTAHGQLIATGRVYRPAMAAPDAESCVRELQGTYATDNHYASKLIAIMRENGLYQFDVARTEGVGPGGDPRA